MKKGTLLIVLLVAFTGGFAQVNNFKKLKPLVNNQYKQDLLNRYQLEPPHIEKAPQSDEPLPPAMAMGVLKIGVEKKLVATNKNGDEIYVVGSDNMPCLSPPKNYKPTMPVLGFTKVTPIGKEE